MTPAKTLPAACKLVVLCELLPLAVLVVTSLYVDCDVDVFELAWWMVKLETVITPARSVPLACSDRLADDWPLPLLVDPRPALLSVLKLYCQLAALVESCAVTNWMPLASPVSWTEESSDEFCSLLLVPAELLPS